MAPLSKLTLTKFERSQTHQDPVLDRHAKALKALAQQRDVHTSHIPTAYSRPCALAFGWLFVVFVTRLVKSPTLRKIVRCGAWTYIALYILGLTAQAENLLESAGFTVGEFRFSMLLLVQSVVILGVLIALANFMTKTTSNRIRTNEDISPSMQVLIVKVMQVVFYAAAFFIGVKSLGIDLTGLAVLSGAIGVGLGFGLQKWCRTLCLV